MTPWPTETLTVTDVADPEDRAVIAKWLSAYNLKHGGPADPRPLNVLLRDDTGAVLGGLWGRTYWRWLFVELLHIPEDLRGRALGARLMALGEAEARTRGCVGIWLDTFSFQAPGFYERLGFERFGALDDYPPGHGRLFYAKRLA